MNKPLKKKAVLITVLCIAVLTAAVVFFWPKHLYHFDNAEVESLTLRNGDKLTRMEITDREQIETVVKLLNNFTYKSTEDVPPAGGWSYWLIIHTHSGDTDVFYFTDYIRIYDDKGGSTLYYCDSSYLQPLVKLAESATEEL